MITITATFWNIIGLGLACVGFLHWLMTLFVSYIPSGKGSTLYTILIYFVFPILGLAMYYGIK